MVPIRKGDGTGLAAKGYSQVRKGDGTVLWNAIADTVVSRPDDDDEATGRDEEWGIRINTSQQWESIGAKLSSGGSGYETAKLYSVNNDSLMDQIDISGLSAGDVIKFEEVSLDANADYDIVVTADDFTTGFLNSPNLPFVSDDGNLSIINGVDRAENETFENLHNILEVGNVGFE